ncbi:hypothetical protein 2050H1_173 [Serratia phage 2050H1]|uniref:Uncharacterized protein n=1 Tax=Serratia phage 2050H1 TaxID=2024250 RepID=A0A249Y2M8_9CAUD|nr:hypothetical protein 2050H1_173 [Serratia phage 2050H1]
MDDVPQLKAVSVFIVEIDCLFDILSPRPTGKQGRLTFRYRFAVGVVKWHQFYVQPGVGASSFFVIHMLWVAYSLHQFQPELFGVFGNSIMGVYVTTRFGYGESVPFRPDFHLWNVISE